MGGTSKRPRTWGSTAPQKRAAIDALRYGPAALPGRPSTRENLVSTLGDPGWMARDGTGGDAGENDPKWMLGAAVCGAVLAVAVGREELRSALAGPDGRLICEQTDKLYVEPPPGRRQAGPDDFEKALAEQLRACVAEGGHPPIVAVAVAWHGRVDPHENEGRGDPHKRSYKGAWAKSSAPLSRWVGKALKRADLKGESPIYVVNDADANMMALAHSTGDDHEQFPDIEDNPGLRTLKEMIEASRVTLGVTIAGGVGGALMRAPEPGVRRTVEGGSHGYVGELGQIPVDVTKPYAEKATDIDGITTLAELKEDKGFPKWKCLYRETLDHYASGRSVVEQLYPRLEGGYTGRIRDIQQRLELGDGDPVLEHIMDRSGRLIGLALIGPTLTIDPDLIVISSFAWSQDLLDGVQQVLGKSAAHVGLEKKSIVLAPADPARTVKGAARWAIEARVSPVLDKVCERGNGKKKFEGLKDELLQGAIVT